MVDCTCIDKTWCANATEDATGMYARSFERQGLSMIIVRRDDVWEVDHFVNGEPDPFYVCLFGSHTNPLPFTPDASDEMLDEYVSALRLIYTQYEISGPQKENAV